MQTYVINDTLCHSYCTLVINDSLIAFWIHLLSNYCSYCSYQVIEVEIEVVIVIEEVVVVVV